jgi:hypothetical protein
MMSSSDMEQTPVQNLQNQFTRVQRQYQQLLDRWTPHTLNRWLSTAGLLAVFFLRIVLSQGVRVPFLSFFSCVKKEIGLTEPISSGT